jgi:hypothetical protein
MKDTTKSTSQHALAQQAPAVSSHRFSLWAPIKTDIIQEDELVAPLSGIDVNIDYKIDCGSNRNGEKVKMGCLVKINQKNGISNVCLAATYLLPAFRRASVEQKTCSASIDCL